MSDIPVEEWLALLRQQLYIKCCLSKKRKPSSSSEVSGLEEFNISVASFTSDLPGHDAKGFVLLRSCFLVTKERRVEFKPLSVFLKIRDLRLVDLGRPTTDEEFRRETLRKFMEEALHENEPDFSGTPPKPFVGTIEDDEGHYPVPSEHMLLVPYYGLFLGRLQAFVSIQRQTCTLTGIGNQRELLILDELLSRFESFFYQQCVKLTRIMGVVAVRSAE